MEKVVAFEVWFFSICLKNFEIPSYLLILVTAASSQIEPKPQPLLQEDGAKQVSAVTEQGMM